MCSVSVILYILLDLFPSVSADLINNTDNLTAIYFSFISLHTFHIMNMFHGE
jgi:hypothetical protein